MLVSTADDNSLVGSGKPSCAAERSAEFEEDGVLRSNVE